MKAKQSKDNSLPQRLAPFQVALVPASTGMPARRLRLDSGLSSSMPVPVLTSSTDVRNNAIPTCCKGRKTHHRHYATNCDERRYNARECIAKKGTHFDNVHQVVSFLNRKHKVADREPEGATKGPGLSYSVYRSLLVNTTTKM
jgi:hypothetical protein